MLTIEEVCAAGKASRSLIREPKGCETALHSSSEVAIPHPVHLHCLTWA